uniref:Uncharacterized protein n=1 Tax=Anguilla anguilla TaxID=7936 RepID=A0A0E9UL30_ANGAN
MAGEVVLKLAAVFWSSYRGLTTEAGRELQ